MCIRDSGTHVPTGEIVNEILQTKFNDVTPTSVIESLNQNKEFSLEKGLNSVNICKKVESSDIIMEGVNTCSTTNDKENARRKDTKESELKFEEMHKVSIRMETYDSSEVVDKAENSNGRSISENLHYTQVSSRENIKIIASLIKDDNHVKENEVIEITGGTNNDVNVFDFESLLEENNLDEWVIKT